MSRRTLGLGLLAVSVAASLVNLAGWLHPMALRWRAHAGIRHTLAIALGSLTAQAVLIILAALLAFWPDRH